MLEIRSIYITGKKGKDGKKQTAKNPKGLMILLGVLYLTMMFAFFGLSFLLGETMFSLQMDWLYFTVLGILAFLLGIFGSVLSTASALFRSKDNELLLSMPIPPSKIILVRMTAVCLMGFLYEACVMIPAVIYYFIAGNLTLAGGVFSVLGIFILGFLITAVSCGAGWLVSVIAVRLNNQKIIRVLLIVVLIGLVYYVRFQLEAIIKTIAEHAAEIAQELQGWGYIVTLSGRGMAGDFAAFLIFTGITAVLFFLAYDLVSRSFAKIALTKSSEKERIFSSADIKTSGLSDALLRRERKRFLASVTYMLNAGLGILLLLAGAVAAIIKLGDIRMLITSLGSVYPAVDRMTPVLAAMAVCVLTSFCVMAACSISMEGQQIWIYQSMPLDPRKIFQAKIYLHVFLTGIPALLCVLSLGIAIQTGIAEFISMVVVTGMYIIMSATLELRLDLKRPKLEWINENQAVKNNLNTLVAMLCAMIVPTILGGLYFLLNAFIGPVAYMVILIGIFAGLTLLGSHWLSGKGREIFGTL